jgi:hypothetical protein
LAVCSTLIILPTTSSPVRSSHRIASKPIGRTAVIDRLPLPPATAVSDLGAWLVYCRVCDRCIGEPSDRDTAKVAARVHNVIHADQTRQTKT